MSLFPSLITIDIGSALSSAISTFFNSLANALTPVISSVANFFINIMNYIIQTLVSFFNNLVNNVANFIISIIVNPFISFIEGILNTFINKLDVLLAFWLTTPFAFKLPTEIRKARSWSSVGFAVGKMMLMPIVGWFTGQVIKSLIFHGTPATVQLKRASITPITPPTPPQPIVGAGGGLITGLVDIIAKITTPLEIFTNPISGLVASISAVAQVLLSLEQDVKAVLSSTVQTIIGGVQNASSLSSTVQTSTQSQDNTAKLTSSVQASVPSQDNTASLTTSIETSLSVVNVSAGITTSIVFQ